MHSELQRKVILEQRKVSDGSHPWCLKEIGSDSTKYTERWVPAKGNYYFTASSIALNTSLSADSKEKNLREASLDEVIVAKLYPGILRQGELQENYRFSTFGTNEIVEVFPFYLKSHEGDETASKCFIHHIGEKTRSGLYPINFEIHLSLPRKDFDLFREMITAKAIDTFELILIGVSGFYKDEFSIGMNRKLLTDYVEATIEIEDSNNVTNGFNGEKTGRVQEWDITLEHQLTLEKFHKFSKTDVSGNPPISEAYIQQSIKPYLKDLQERAEHQQVRSSLHSIILQTASNIAEYSNAISESRLNYKKRLADAIEVVRSIKSSIHASPLAEKTTEDKKTKNQTDQLDFEQPLWLHGNLHTAYQEGWESAHHIKIDKIALEHEAVKYLQRPWMWDDHLEWVMIDALMFCEAIEFGEYIKQNLPEDREAKGDKSIYFSGKGNLKKMGRARQKNHLMKSLRELLFLIAIPTSAFIFFWDLYHKDLFVWGLGIYLASLVFYAGSKFLWRTNNNQIDEEHADRYSKLLSMRNIYAELDTGVINPSYLRGRLLDTASKGVVWSGAIFSLIDNVIERNPMVWTHRGDPYINL